MRKEFQTWHFWLGVWKNFFVVFGLVAAGISVVAGFAPDVLPKHQNFLVYIILIAALYSLWNAWPKQVHQSYVGSFSVDLVEGDLFEQQGNSLISMTDTFDIQIPDIISASSLQGQLLHRIWNDDACKLEGQLSALLRDIPTIGSVSKPGNTFRYPLGTTLPVRGPEGNIYFCTALARMSEKNVALSTIESLTSSLYAAWECADQFGNHEPIHVPLIGQGLSRIPGFGSEAAIRLIALTFVLRSNRGRVSSSLTIVVRPEEAKKINQREFASFLRSLPGAE